MKRANADPENTRSLKTSTVRKSVEKNVLEDEDSDVPIRIKRREQISLPILINGEVFLPPKLGEGSKSPCSSYKNLSHSHSLYLSCMIHATNDQKQPHEGPPRKL